MASKSMETYIGSSGSDTTFRNGVIINGWKDAAASTYCTNSNYVSTRAGSSSTKQCAVLYCSIIYSATEPTCTIRWYLSTCAFTSATNTTVTSTRYFLKKVYLKIGSQTCVNYTVDNVNNSKYNVSSSSSTYHHNYKASDTSTWGEPYLEKGTTSAINYSTTPTVSITFTTQNGSASAESTKTVTLDLAANAPKAIYTVEYYDADTKLGSSSHVEGTAKALTTMATLGGSLSGYTFYGWSTANNNVTRTYTDGQSVTSLSTTTGDVIKLYALWSRTDTFYSGLAKATTNTATEIYNNNGVQSCTIPAAPTAISGWTALGWRANTTATSQTYATTGTITSARNATYYAVYSRTGTIAYANGGGSGTTPTSQTGTQYYNSNGSVSTFAVTLAANPYTRTGYTFNGWSLGAASSSYTYNQGVSASASITATAQWTGISYTIAYYVNGTKKTTSSHVYGTAKALTTASAMSATMTGYSFYGWSTTDKNLTRTYTDGQSVTSLTSTSGGTVNLYAIFSRTMYFYSGINAATTRTSIQYTNNGTYSCAVAAGPASLDTYGWTTLGWRSDDTASSATVPLVGTGTITIAGGTSGEWLAVYSRTLTLNYSANGGTGTTTAQTLTQYYNSNGNITDPAFTTRAALTKTGYTFYRWSSVKSSTGSYAAGATYKFGSLASVTGTTVADTLTATWTANTYTVTFNANGGGTPSPASKTVTYDSTYGTLATISRTGYTFNGWYTATSGGTKIATTTTVAITANQTLYAQWTINSYTVSYNANGGTSTLPSTQSGNYATSVTLAAAMTKSNTTANGYKVTYNANGVGTAPSAVTVTDTTSYTFDKWALGSASGTKYAAKASYTIPASNSTFYATWSQTVTKGNLKLATMSDVEQGSGSSYVKWIFQGWNTASNGTGTAYAAGTTITPTANMTLYAQWESDKAVVTYNANDGSGTTSVTVNKNSTITLNDGSGFSKTNSKLLGWNTKADGTGTKYTLGASLVVSANITLYAYWYTNFAWSNASLFATGQPVNKALASEWNTLQNNIKTYVKSTFTPTTASANSKITAASLNAAINAVDSSIGTVTAGNKMTEFSKLTQLATQVNTKAEML